MRVFLLSTVQIIYTKPTDYRNDAGWEAPDDAVAKPMSIPAAVKETGAEAPVSVSPPDEDAGRAIVTMGGTVNVPALVGAVQVNIAPAP